MLGLIAPTSGGVEIFGLDTQACLPKILPRMGAMTESIGFCPYLSGEEDLNYVARITRGVSSSRIGAVLELVELSGREKDATTASTSSTRWRLTTTIGKNTGLPDCPNVSELMPSSLFAQHPFFAFAGASPSTLHASLILAIYCGVF